MAFGNDVVARHGKGGRVTRPSVQSNFCKFKKLRADRHVILDDHRLSELAENPRHRPRDSNGDSLVGLVPVHHHIARPIDEVSQFRSCLNGCFIIGN